MMNILRRMRALLAASLLLPLAAPAQTVAVAANAKGVAAELAAAYAAHGAPLPATVVAASGVLAAQVRNGAPYDLFLSADTAYPAALARDGKAEPPRVYAYGRLILWSRNSLALARGLAVLTDSAVRSIAVANPRNAPFGAAAVAALRAGGVYERVAPRIVYGESIAQVNQYVDTRAADVGITSASAIHGLAAPGAWVAIDTALYPPIPLGAAVLRRGAAAEERAARAFLAFLLGAEGRAILARWGYSLP